jgi:hypothetical protein
LVLKGFEDMEQHPEEFVMTEDSPKDEKAKEITNESSLMERISGWFTEDHVN